MKEKFYLLKTPFLGKKSFYYAIVSYENKSYEIKIGGFKKRPCIIILFEKGSIYADLDSVNNDISCIIFNNETLQHNIHNLVKTSLHFLISLFPYIKKVNIVDNRLFINSINTRLSSNNLNINLSDLTFIKYGYTWYEKYFGAVPNHLKKDFINLKKKYFIDTLQKEIDIDKDSFIKANIDYIKQYIDKKTLDNVINNIEKKYKKNIKLEDYLHSFIDENKPCINYVFVMNIYLNKVFYDTKWTIYDDKIKNYFIDNSIKYTFIETTKKKTHEEVINSIKKFNALNKTNELIYDEKKENIFYTGKNKSIFKRIN